MKVKAPKEQLSREPRHLVMSQAIGVVRIELGTQATPISGVTGIGEFVEMGD